MLIFEEITENKFKISNRDSSIKFDVNCRSNIKLSIKNVFILIFREGTIVYIIGDGCGSFFLIGLQHKMRLGPFKLQGIMRMHDEEEAVVFRSKNSVRPFAGSEKQSNK